MRRHTGVGKDLGGLCAFLERESQQQPLGGDVLVACLLGDLLGLIEDAGKLTGRAGLACTATRYLRPLRERRIDGREGLLGVAAGLADEA